MDRKLPAVMAIALCCLLPARAGVSAVPATAADAPVEIATLAEADSPSVPSVEAGVAAAIAACATEMSQPEQEQLTDTVVTESQRHGYDPFFVQAMLEVESACNPRARGSHGSLGLVQLRPSTARAVAEDAGVLWKGPATLHDSSVNVRLAVHYLSQLEERFSDPYLALAAYNLGPTRVAQLPRARARRSIYVRKVLQRYHDLLASEAERES